jgi:serine/threonine protein phosphatase PrpC
MTLAIRGDRASCLSLQLGPRTWLLAVASGFGSIDGLATEAALLARLRAECERRVRSARFRRAIDRPQAAATAMLALLTRVNGDLYACTASHEDYVTAAASLTAVVIVHGYAYVMHAGATAAYLARDGAIVSLSRDDVFDERRRPLLVRALAVAPVLDVTISSAILAPGDAIVLVGRRLRDEVERRALLGNLDASDPGEHVLIARFEQDDSVPADARGAPARQPVLMPAVARCAAAIAFLAAAVFAH